MKSSHAVFLSIYVISIVVGFGVGKTIQQSELVEKHLTPVSIPEQSIPTLKNGQHNLLVITVDNLQLDKPRLTSVWLVTYFLDNPSITFLPISPTSSNSVVTLDKKLYESFEIVRSNDQVSISTGFLNNLTLSNFWWSGYLIVDQQAFLSVLNEQNNLDATNRELADEKNTTIPLAAGDDPEIVYATYTRILQDTCHLIALDGENFDWQSFTSLIPLHVSTDLNAKLMINEWMSSLATVETPLCYFPLVSHATNADEQ